MNAYRIAYGWITQAEIESRATSAVESFPIQSDQFNRPWVRPDNNADVVSPFAKRVVDLRGVAWREGGARGVFALRVLTPKMAQYVETTLFPDNAEGGKLTLIVFNRATGEWEAYNAYGNKPEPTANELVGGGYDKYAIAWVNGVRAPAGVDAAIEGAFASALVVGVAASLALTVENVGEDSARVPLTTFAPLVVVVPLPSNLPFVSIAAGAGWVSEWSTDAGATYTNYTSPPPIPDNVNRVRFTYADALVAGASAPTVAVNVRPNAAGSASVTATLTTTGDTNTTNNVVTVTANIAIGSAWSSGFSSGFGANKSAFSSGFSSDFGAPKSGFSSGFSNGFGAA